MGGDEAETMIERVARALAAADDECDWDERPDQSETAVLYMPKSVFRQRARAALEAMLEPTEAMIGTSQPDTSLGRQVRGAVWRMMIDAALAEKA